MQLNTLKTDKRYRMIFTVCFCLIVGWLVRILYCFYYVVPVRDSYEYREQIILWKENGLFAIGKNTPVLGLYLLKLPNDLFGVNILKGGIGINIFLGLLIIITLMAIAAKLTNSHLIVLTTGLIAATHPTLVHYSCQMLRENSYLLFFCLTVLTTIDFIKNLEFICLLFSGLFTACACLCRYEAIEIVFFCLLFIFLVVKKLSFTKRLIACGIYVCSFLIFISSISYALGLSPLFYKEYFQKAQESAQIDAVI